MQLAKFYENLEDKRIYFFKLGALIFSAVAVNLVASKSMSGSKSLAIFLVLEVMLFMMKPIYAFVLAFVMHVDIMSVYNFDPAKMITLICMYAVFFFDAGGLSEIFENKRLKTVFYLGVFFGLYAMIVNVGLKDGLNIQKFLVGFGYVFGFLTILPAYYYTMRQPKELVTAFAVVAGAFLCIYFLDMAKGLNLFGLTDMDRGTGANIERKAGYDLRQMVIFFAYLIPASLLAVDLKVIQRYVLLGIGLLAYAVLVLAFYRLAMFYVAAGGVIAFLFIRRYAKNSNVFKIFLYLLVLFVVVNFFFGEYLTEVNKLFSATLDYFSGKGQDTSADARTQMQMPVLTTLIYNNLWTGAGLFELRERMDFGMFGFVDIPLLGSLAAYGVIGMLIYYSKFLFILGGNGREARDIYNSTYDHSQFTLYVYLTLKAYLITMITVRFFYISWEATVNYLQGEFGLLVGVYLALQQVMKESYYHEEEELEVQPA